MPVGLSTGPGAKRHGTVLSRPVFSEAVACDSSGAQPQVFDYQYILSVRPDCLFARATAKRARPGSNGEQNGERSLNGIALLSMAEDLTGEVLVCCRTELLVRHHPRENLLIAFHPIDKQLIQHPLKVR